MTIQRFTGYSINTVLYLTQDGMIPQSWGALHKAWIGYVIAKNKGEYDKQIQYASIIQKLQKELNLRVSIFPQLGLYRMEDKADDYNSEYTTATYESLHDEHF